MSPSTHAAPPRTSFISSLSARSSPAVPPASQAYESLVKAVLTHRLRRKVFACSDAFSFLLYIFLSGRDHGSLTTRLLSPSAWLAALLVWIVGVVPIIVLRKVNLANHHGVAPSPKSTVVTALSKPSMRRSIAVYTSSALLFLAVHLYSAPALRESLPLNVFVKSRKHPYYLNGHLIFLVMAQTWFALSFVVRNVMLERFVFRGARHAPSNVSIFFVNVPILLVTMALFTLLSLMAYNTTIGLARMLVLPVLLRIPLLQSVLQPFIAHFARGPWTFILPLRHLSLEYRTFILGFIMLVNWEFAETLFDLYIPQPTEISQTTSDPNVTVTSGITSSNFVFLHFAYSELRNVATDANPSGSARRTALFSDQKYNPSLWGTLVRQSLLLLGQDYQTLLRRGEPAPPVPSAPVSTPSTPKPPNPPPSTPILRQPIYKPPQESPLSRILNTFASDSELSKATDEVAAEVEAIAKDVQVPELFRSVASTATSAIPSSTAVAIQKPAATTSAFTTRLQQEYGGLLVRYAPVYLRDVMSRVNEWWTRERIHKRAEISLPRRELDVLIIDSLSALVCASLAEDRYGVVQRDIPRILEALLSFLAAVEDYQNEVRVLYVPPTPDELTGGNRKMLHEKERTRVEVAKASEVLSVVGDALKSGISDIVRTFGDKLSAFKFPPKTAKKLQGFVDYI